MENHTRKLAARRCGFTIVEATIVMLILGIMAAVAVPRYSKKICQYRVDIAAKRIAIDLELAQRRARVASVSQSVQFVVNTHSYTLPGIADINKPSTTYTVKLKAEPFQTTLVSADFSGSPTITYDGFGRPNHGGTIVIRVGDYERTVTVDPDTGKATTS